MKYKAILNDSGQWFTNAAGYLFLTLIPEKVCFLYLFQLLQSLPRLLELNFPSQIFEAFNKYIQVI